MKQSKKLLCMLLVMLMAFSSVSIGVSAAYTDYRNAPTSYDVHENPILSTAQRSSQLLDYVDEVLAKEDINIDAVVLKIDLTSVDKALNTLDDIKGATGAIGGDVKKLNFNSLSGVRRTTAGTTDLNILYDLINFIYDNRGIVAKFVRGELDLGILKPFVKLDFNIYTMLIDMLYEKLLDESSTAAPAGWTADMILQTVVDSYLTTGGTDAKGKPIEPILPSMAGKTNINAETIWNILENAANAATKDLLVPLIENTLKPKLAEWEVENPSTIWSKLNIDNLNLAAYTWGQYDPTNGIVAELNHFVYYVLDSVWTGDKFWVDGGNDKLYGNIENLLKILYKELGTTLLPASAEFLPVEEVEAMNLQELCGYIGKQYLSAEMPNIYWEHYADEYYSSVETAEPKNVTELACYVIYSFTADFIETSYIENVDTGFAILDTDYALTMLADIGAYYLNAVLPINAQKGQGVEALLSVLVNWALKDSNFGGFLNGCNVTDYDSVWTKIDKTVFKILPLQQILGGNIQGSYDLIMNHLVYAIFDLDFEAIFELFYKSPSSMLHKTIPEVVVWIANNVLNVLVTKNTNATVLYNPTPTAVDTLIQNNNLAVSAERLLVGLKQCATHQYFWDSLLPILNPLLVDESVYVYNQSNTPSGYPVQTLEQLQAKIDEYNALLAVPEDTYDRDPANWNRSTDFELYRYDKIEKAIDDAVGTINGYNGAVQWVADAQVRIQEANDALAAANASGVQADIDAANAEVTAANQNLTDANAKVASYTPAVYAEAGYSIEEAYNKAEANRGQSNTSHLFYVLGIADLKEYNKRDYTTEVWANYEKAYETASYYCYDADVNVVKQSQINYARKNLIDAMRLLEVKLANMEELAALIAEVKDTNLDGFSQETIDAFQAALADAQNMVGQLLSIDRQDDVDRMVRRLKDAFESLAADVIIPVLESIASGVKIDADKNFISGIDTLTSVAELLSKYIKSDENGSLAVETVNGASKVGTGAKVILKDSNGSEVATYEIVIYGDANGDGIVDLMDTLCLDLYTVYDANHNYKTGSAQWTALNLDNSGAVDASDAIILDSYANFEGDINQQNPFAA